MFFPLDASLWSCHDLSRFITLTYESIILVYVYDMFLYDCAWNVSFIRPSSGFSDGSTEELLFDPTTELERQQSWQVSKSTLCPSRFLPMNMIILSKTRGVYQWYGRSTKISPLPHFIPSKILGHQQQCLFCLIIPGQFVATNPPISHQKVVNSKGILPNNFLNCRDFWLPFLLVMFWWCFFVSQVLLGRT